MPINIRPYRYNPFQKDEIEKQVKEMLLQGIIQQSYSPYASPVLLVQKKDLSWRFYVDYRHLNAITVKNIFPMPVVEELLDELAGAVWFTSLDPKAGYHKIRMAPEDVFKTAFKTHLGHYEFKGMPYGLAYAPDMFQGVMNFVLSPLLCKGVLVFVDYILVYSHTLQAHARLLKQVFELLQEHQLKVKRSKCKFSLQELTYLGHVISAQGVATEEKNISAVKNWPILVTSDKSGGSWGWRGTIDGSCVIFLSSAAL